jgi:hypothetical protein
VLGKHGEAVGALDPANLDHAHVLETGEHGVKDAALGLVLAQAEAKLNQHGVVKARVGQWEMKGVLPGDAVLQREHGIAV